MAKTSSLVKSCHTLASLVFLLLPALAEAADVSASDPRNIRNGHALPSEGYCDQPYVVVGADGRWLCVLTTGPGREGQAGQHVVSTVSSDRGKTWSKLVDIEPVTGPEASWAVPLLTPAGRVYAFYDFNGDRVSTLGSRKNIRADMLGWYVYRYSDDFGQTWSERQRLPMRLTACDRGNDWQGKVQIFWGICKPQIAMGQAYFSFTKLGKYLLDQGEGWVYHSDNILTEKDPARLHWDLWPAGESGIRSPALGSVQEEHNLVWQGGRRWYCVYRTTTGHPAHCFSTDGGKTWSMPVPMTYAPSGQQIKTPRACPRLFRTANGKFLFWFHNHSGKTFEGRNPAWISGGILKDDGMHWSQPEILLYDPEPKTRMTYPDLVEQDGRYWITETNKTLSSVHEIDSSLLEGLWHQGEARTIARTGNVLDVAGDELASKKRTIPGRLDLQKIPGLSLDLWLDGKAFSADQVILDTSDAAGRGLKLVTTKAGSLRVECSDGTTRASWESDRMLFMAGAPHHVVVTLDAGPKIFMFVVDGKLCDGGTQRQYGWGRWQGGLGDVTGTGIIRMNSVLKRLRVYNRPLRTSEAVAHYHAGL